MAGSAFGLSVGLAGREMLGRPVWKEETAPAGEWNPARCRGGCAVGGRCNRFTLDGQPAHPARTARAGARQADLVPLSEVNGAYLRAREPGHPSQVPQSRQSHEVVRGLAHVKPHQNGFTITMMTMTIMASVGTSFNTR
jgi:hypothetical protein